MKLNSIIISCDSNGEQMKVERIFNEFGIKEWKRDDDYMEFDLTHADPKMLEEIMKKLEKLF